MASKFVYERDRTPEEVQRLARRPMGGFDRYVIDGIAWFKPKEGENCIRIIPLTKAEKDLLRKAGEPVGWDLRINLHNNVGPDETSYLCTAKNGLFHDEEPCSVCDAKKLDDEERKQLRVAWRALVWLIDRNNEKAGPQVWSMPPTVHQEMMSRNTDKKTNATIFIDDPDDGYDFYFVREGTKLRTDYKQMEFARDPSPLHNNEKIQAKWLDYILENPLIDTMKFYPAEHIKAALYGEGAKRSQPDDGDGAGESAELPSRSSRRPAPEADENDPPPRSSRRGGAETEGDEVPFEGGSRRNGRGGEGSGYGDENDPPPRSSRRGDPAPEDDPPPRSSRRGGGETEGEKEPARGGNLERRRQPMPEDDPPPRTSRGRAEPEENERDARAGNVASGGRERLSRLDRNVRR